MIFSPTRIAIIKGLNKTSEACFREASRSADADIFTNEKAN
jgi:hypothetical protein